MSKKIRVVIEYNFDTTDEYYADDFADCVTDNDYIDTAKHLMLQDILQDIDSFSEGDIFDSMVATVEEN